MNVRSAADCIWVQESKSIVDALGGQILGEPIASPRFPKKNEGGPKREGMARDSEGNFYLVGAHNGKTDPERATKSVLIRFRVNDSESPTIDDTSVTRWHVARSLEAALKAEGLSTLEVAKRKVEGLTIREQKNADGTSHRELFIGLRDGLSLSVTFDYAAPDHLCRQLSVDPLPSTE